MCQFQDILRVSDHEPSQVLHLALQNHFLLGIEVHLPNYCSSLTVN